MTSSKWRSRHDAHSLAQRKRPNAQGLHNNLCTHNRDDSRHSVCAHVYGPLVRASTHRATMLDGVCTYGTGRIPRILELRTLALNATLGRSSSSRDRPWSGASVALNAKGGKVVPTFEEIQLITSGTQNRRAVWVPLARRGFADPQRNPPNDQGAHWLQRYLSRRWPGTSSVVVKVNETDWALIVFE